MKISYGITVYNEYKELDNLLFHLSKHIREEDEVVITQDISKVGDKSIVQDEFYALEKILEKYEYGTYFSPRQLKVTSFNFDKDFSALKNVELGDRLAHLVLVDNPPQHPNGDFTLSDDLSNGTANHGVVSTFEQEKAGEALTFSGISILSPQLFADLPEGKRPLAPLLKDAMQQGLVSGEKMSTAWVDVGTPERLMQLDEQIRKQQI